MIKPSKQRKEQINTSDSQNNKQEIGAIFALFPHIPLQSSENPGTTSTFDVRNVPFFGNVKNYFSFFLLHPIFPPSFTCTLINYSYTLVYNLVQSRSLLAVS